jgi:outer membrane lipoprotein SlyB
METEMLRRFSQVFALVACALLFVAWPENVVHAKDPARVEYGTVEAIEIHRSADTPPINTGTVVGGIAGGVIGHQIGSGRGNTAATIAGAIGGAVVGNEIEKKQTHPSRYRVTVHLDSGSSLIIDDTRDGNLRVGDRVRVEDNQLYRI